MLDVTLAQSGPGIDWSQLIGLAMVVLFLSAGWLAKVFKAIADRRGSGGGGTSAGGGRASKLEQMAARRREQLERMAQRQDPRSQPNNMTMAERVEREKAQQAYRQRAEALRRQQQQQQAQAGRGGGRAQSTGGQARRRTGQQAGAQRTARRTPPRQQQPQRQRTREVEPVEVLEVDEKRIEVVDVSPKGTVQRRTLIQLGKLNRRSLKHAIIMKELLDRPVALRASHPSAEEL